MAKPHGWTVQDVSLTESYDLVCHRTGRPELHVEVKGTQSPGTQIILTRNEVTHAQAHYPNVALCSVANVICHPTASGFVVTGGDLILYEPWQINPDRLTPLSYQYKVQ